MGDAQFQTWIGKRETARETLTARLGEQFAATFDLPGEWGDGAIAPRMIHWCLCQQAVDSGQLAADGHPARGGFLPPVDLPRRMWAGGDVTFLRDLHIGEDITRSSTIEDVTFKQGRSGPLCFVTVRHDYAASGQVALRERQDIVFRGADTATPDTRDPAGCGAHTRRVDPSGALLFRYSAVTFNAHRIHYDLPYTRDVEQYPGLVVHGPMQATLLCHLAGEVAGRAPRRFRFRSLAPVFDTAPFEINAAPDGDALTLWTAQAGGPVAMEARATW